MSKYGARYCLFCADINDQSYFPAASPDFPHLRFGKTDASTCMPQINGLKIAIEIHIYFLFRNRINMLNLDEVCRSVAALVIF